MKQSSTRKLLAPLVWLALACAEEPMAVRSVGPGDDHRDAGDGDAGDGESDGDGEEPAASVEVTRIPTPDSSASWRPLALNNEGHVLLGSYAARDGSAREVIWRGGDDFVEVEPPQGFGFLKHVDDYRRCLFDDGRVLTLVASPTFELATVILGDGEVVMADELKDAFHCNGAGQVVTSDGIWGSGAFVPFAVAMQEWEVAGINEAGALALRTGYWEDGTVTPYGDELFLPYHGPSADGLVLGSYDEAYQTGEPAVLWSAKTGEIVTTLPPLPDDEWPVPGPHFISENGDVVVGTNTRGDNANEVYLFHEGRYYRLAAGELNTSTPIDINDRNQVVCAPAKRSFGTEEQGEFVGVLFTPLD